MSANAPLVHLCSAFGAQTGYEVHARNFAAALGRVCECVLTDLRDPPEQRWRALPLLRERAAAGTPVVNIVLAPPSLFGEVPDLPGQRIGYFVWEKDVLPDEWREAALGMDRVWTASRWGRDVLVGDGIPGDAVDVVPEGVDTALFRPDGPDFPPLTRDPRFKFLNVGKFEERKNTAGLICAFDAEFADTPDAVLVLSCTNFFKEGFDLTREVAALGVRCGDRIIGARWVQGHDTLASIYRSCDAFVAPVRAEGWGLPIMEAMASGLPTVVTNYSAMTDYATPDTALLLDASLVPCTDSPLTVRGRTVWGRWAEPDAAQLRRAMRWCYERRDEARAMGRRAAGGIAGAWTWDHAAARALAAIRAAAPGG